MNTIRHQIAIAAPLSKVYKMLSTPKAIGKWWDEQTVVESNEGIVMEHDPGAEHGKVRLKVVQQKADVLVEWKCISDHPDSSPASAWTGTHFLFEVSEDDSPASIIERSCSGNSDASLTTLNFSQTGYDPASKFYGFNNHAWGQVLENLKSVCETEK
ncbi:MAG: hypothetical protein KA250_03215 [Verrucomicrobiales bacterium]|nr:hypothetical protein [Verrucomicrobiales bacterium]